MNATPDHVADLPMVVRTSAGTVVMEMSVPDAEILANILARYDVIAGTARDIAPLKHYSSEVWQHTLIRLLCEVAHLKAGIAETVDVDIAHVDLIRRRPQLHIVESGADK